MSVEADLLREQTAKIVNSGALGRSRSYGRLLEFLVESAVNGHTPKELEIAMEVFGRGADFDPSQDSMVRVYAHNLRQKLEHFYATGGRSQTRQLTLARGEYRISLAAIDPAAVSDAPPPAAAVAAPSPPQPDRGARPRERWRGVAGAARLIALGVAVGVGIMLERAPAVPAATTVARSSLWAGLLDDELPILIVVGE
jgi:hypothetical protein